MHIKSLFGGLGRPAITRLNSFLLRPHQELQSWKCAGFISSSSGGDDEKALIPIPEVRRFILDTMKAVGTPAKQAQELADVLIAADYRGHFSHGLNRLG
jgi:hypothetical protein